MIEKRIWFLNKIKGYGCIGLFFLPFVLVGIWTLFYSLINIYNSQRTEYWTKVPATIEHVELEYDSDSDGGGTYEVHIGYKYIINDKQYFGNKIAYGYGGNNTEDHSALFNKLENSKKIAVFVNPKDNSNVIIIKGINNSIIGLLIFSIMWNSLLSIFIIPLFLKEDSKFSFKHISISVITIWIIGISLLVSDSIKIPFEDKIEVIESKKLIEAAR